MENKLLPDIDTTNRNEIMSPFLRLPPELRNAIYAHICDTPLIVYQSWMCQRYIVKGWPPLLSACRQTQTELKSFITTHACLDIRSNISALELIELTGENLCAGLVRLEMTDDVAAAMGCCWFASEDGEVGQGEEVRIRDLFSGVRRVVLRESGLGGFDGLLWADAVCFVQREWPGAEIICGQEI